jgi:hypothetical protein
MKKKISRILGVVLSLALLSSFFIAAAPVAAQPGQNAWDTIDLPQVFPGSDVGPMDIAPDGTIYCAFWDRDSTPPDTIMVMKSMDGGFNWIPTTHMIVAPSIPDDIITDIQVSPNYLEDGRIYVAHRNGNLYRLEDEGNGLPILLKHPYATDHDPGLASLLHDIDLWFDGNYVWILAATDVDVLVLKDDPMFEAWRDQDLSLHDDWDVGLDYFYGAVEVAFAPDFEQSSLIWAVFVDDYGDHTIASTINPGQWGWLIDDVYVDHPATAEVYVDIAFPDFYSSDEPILYVALSDGSDNGNLYLVEGRYNPDITDTTPLLADYIDVVSVEVSGEVILATATWYPTIFRSDNLGDTFDLIGDDPFDGTEGWGPTGSYMGRVYMKLDHGEFDPDDGVAYYVARGYESGVSRSTDGGVTWHGTGLIDTEIDNINDVAFSPETGSQPALLLTDDYGGAESLWRTEDATADAVKWERVLCSDFVEGLSDPSMVEYAMDGSAIMLYESGRWTGDVEIWKSTNNADTFDHWRTLPDPPFDDDDINDWVIYNSATIYCATDYGFYGTSQVGPATLEDPGGDALNDSVLVSIALQPGFDPADEDNDVMIVGSSDGYIYVSADAGDNWSGANDIGDNTSYGNFVYVAFDADFAKAGADGEGVIYFASEASTVGQAVVDIGVPDLPVTWALDDIMPLLDDTNGAAATGSFTGLVVAPDNALYAMSVTSGGSGSPGTIEAGGVLSFIGATSFAFGTTALMVPPAIYGVTPATGNFIDGEVLSVVDSSLYVDAPGGGSATVSGTIVVEGALSGTRGQFDLTYQTVYWAWGAGPPPIMWEAVIVDSSALWADVIGATPGDETPNGMYRLLLHDWLNIWEFADDEVPPDVLTTPVGLWYTPGTNILWTIDMNDDELWALEDTVSGKVSLLSPNDGTILPTTDSAALSWNAMTGAKKYEGYVLNTEDKYFSSVTTSTTVTGLTPMTEYDWLVRVAPGSPFSSRWSSARDFTTLEFVAMPDNEVPENGMQDAPLLPSFLWISSATSFEFELGTAPDFSNATKVTTTVPRLTWTTELEYDTNYYWRVRAIGVTGVKSEWCVSNFHTRVEAIPPVTVPPAPTPTIILPTPTVEIPDITLPQPTVTVEPPDITVELPTPTITTVQTTLEIPEEVTPAYIWAIVAIGALLTLAVIVLIIRTRRVV